MRDLFSGSNEYRDSTSEEHHLLERTDHDTCGGAGPARLTPGTVVEFELAPGKAILRKGAGKVHPIDQLYGLLNLKRRTDEMIDEMRGPRPRKP